MPNSSTPDAVEAAAADVHDAALVLERAYDARYLMELCIAWFEVPSFPAAAVITGLAPLGKHLTLLSLLNWRIEPQLAYRTSAGAAAGGGGPPASMYGTGGLLNQLRSLARFSLPDVPTQN